MTARHIPEEIVERALNGEVYGGLCFHGVKVTVIPPEPDERHPWMSIVFVGHVVTVDSPDPMDLSPVIDESEVVTYRVMLCAPQAGQVVESMQTAYTEYVESNPRTFFSSLLEMIFGDGSK
jgi:hypothetical protein